MNAKRRIPPTYKTVILIQPSTMISQKFTFLELNLPRKHNTYIAEQIRASWTELPGRGEECFSRAHFFAFTFKPMSQKAHKS